MTVRTLVLAVVLVAAAVTIALALISNENVGPVEYVAGVVLVAGLAVLAVRASRRGLQPSA